MKEEVRKHQQGEQNHLAGVGQPVPIMTLRAAANKCHFSERVRDTLVTSTVLANQTLVAEYLSLQKSTVAIYSQETALRLAAVCKGENYYCFHPASGNMKAPNQGPHSRLSGPARCPVNWVPCREASSVHTAPWVHKQPHIK